MKNAVLPVPPTNVGYHVAELFVFVIVDVAALIFVTTPVAPFTLKTPVFVTVTFPV